jgi:hypothetical protein
VVEHHGGAEGGGALAGEGLGPQQSRLLGVGEQDHDVVAGWCDPHGGQGPGDLEQHSHPQAVVPGPR